MQTDWSTAERGIKPGRALSGTGGLELRHARSSVVRAEPTGARSAAPAEPGRGRSLGETRSAQESQAARVEHGRRRSSGARWQSHV